MTYAIYKHPEKGLACSPAGFSPWAYLFGPVWALFSRLWLVAVLVFGAEILLSICLGFVRQLYWAGALPVWIWVTILVLYPTRVYLAFRGGYWKQKRLEATGYEFCGEVRAGLASSAMRKARQGNFRARGSQRFMRSGFNLGPKGFKPTFAILWLTWKAAFRLRLFVVVAVLLLVAVVGLPLLLKDDGTARGFTQILLTYTLSTITILLGLSTLWLACGTLARDIEECQMQVVAVKPIPRWQIWFGKWLGILTLNAALLAISGAAVYCLLLWRADTLPPDQARVLRSEILVARGSAKPRPVTRDIEEQTEERLKEKLRTTRIDRADLTEVRKQIREQVKADYQLVPPAFEIKWEIDLGSTRHSLVDRPLFLRVKFNSADKNASGTFDGLWRVGEPKKTRLWQSDVLSFAPDTFHEIQIAPNLFDEKTGVLTVRFINPAYNTAALLFPLEDGVEVLYPEGTFGLNYMRGLGIIFCWMALLGTIGLAASSFLSFPVAAFVSLALLAIVMAQGTMANAVEEGTVANYNAEKGTKGSSILDPVIIPTFKGVLAIIGMAKDFSPVDSLSTGRSITWAQLGQAFAQIVLLLGGLAALFGVTIFTRRELATAQGTQ